MNGQENRVLIIDHDFVKREKFSSALDSQDGIKVVKSASDIPQALKIVKNDVIHLVLVDIDKPVFNHIETIKTIRRIQPNTRIVIFSLFEYETPYEDLLVPAINAGVQGFFTKDMPIEQIAQLLKQIYQGQLVFAPKPAELLMNAYVKLAQTREKNRDFTVLVEKLPIRLRATFNLLLEAKTNNEIAQILCMQPSTIRSYVSEILAHTGCASRGEVAAKAIKAGIHSLK